MCIWCDREEFSASWRTKMLKILLIFGSGCGQFNTINKTKIRSGFDTRDRRLKIKILFSTWMQLYSTKLTYLPSIVTVSTIDGYSKSNFIHWFVPDADEWYSVSSSPSIALEAGRAPLTVFWVGLIRTNWFAPIPVTRATSRSRFIATEKSMNMMGVLVNL